MKRKKIERFKASFKDNWVLYIRQPHTMSCKHADAQSCKHWHMNASTRTNPLLIFLTHTRNTQTHAQTQCTNTKQMSPQSRWSPFRVELKASAKQAPPGRRGVHQPAKAPARCPRVARVTLGLLPSHCLDQRGPLLSSRRWQQRG